jgi:hypothetical protein
LTCYVSKCASGRFTNVIVGNTPFDFGKIDKVGGTGDIDPSSTMPQTNAMMSYLKKREDRL